MTFLFNIIHNEPVDTSGLSAETVPTLILTVEDLSRGGAGVAREPSGRAVFVPKTLPGDRVRVAIVEDGPRRSPSKRSKWAEGRLIEVLEPSAQRVAPPCPVFDRCGGCQWQHVPYPLQWKTKLEGVLHALRRSGVANLPAAEEFPAANPFGYRNRVQLRGRGAEIGFLEPASHRLVPTDHCEIARPEINAEWERIRSEGSRRPEPEYKVEAETTGSGGVRLAWNARHGALGFRQVNDEQNARMREWIASVLSPADRLLDLYGGSGNLSIPLAARMARVDCVDLGAPERRPEGAPANVTFHRSSVLRWLMREPKPASGAAAAIVDPPREGLAEDLGEIAHALHRLGVRELIAVGCAPDAWARDLSRLASHGWSVDRLGVFDFFPQTPHVESVALLRRVSL